jgi:hypothetical protein
MGINTSSHGITYYDEVVTGWRMHAAGWGVWLLQRQVREGWAPAFAWETVEWYIRPSSVRAKVTALRLLGEEVLDDGP